MKEKKRQFFYKNQYKYSERKEKKTMTIRISTVSKEEGKRKKNGKENKEEKKSTLLLCSRDFRRPSSLLRPATSVLERSI